MDMASIALSVFNSGHFSNKTSSNWIKMIRVISLGPLATVFFTLLLYYRVPFSSEHAICPRWFVVIDY